MKHLLASLALLTLTTLSSYADSLHLPAKQGTANGKKIVLIAGDEEYRSEETAPMLAKILSQKYGFDCTVLFSINPNGNYIDPNHHHNIPNLQALDSADLLIIGTRFRQLPDNQLTHFAKFLNDGKPVIGFRTATHAFKGDAKTNNFPWADFGYLILGERWVNHHGIHNKQGTRSVIENPNKSHPILNGIGEIFGYTDVYGIKNLDQNTATILLRGAVTESLRPNSKNIDGPKNSPMMPLAWLREYTAPNGSTKGLAFCTTLGASIDFANENLRRLLINASHHLLQLPVPTKADVTPIDKFQPTYYGNHPNEYYQKLNRKPADYSLGKSPATGGKKIPTYPDESGEGAPHAPNTEPSPASISRPQTVAPPTQGERIILIGNGLAERDVYYHRLETELHLRYPTQQLFLRNMGHVGDTPGFRPHPSRPSQWAFPGAEKFHPDKQTHNGTGFYPTPDQWLTHLKPDTIVAFFGYNESFDGPAKVANFTAELDAWVQHTLSKAYNGKSAPRLVLVSPIAFQNLTTHSKHDLPTGTKENENLALYSHAIENIAKKHHLTFIDLFNPTKELYSKSNTPLTTDGFIPNDAGYQAIAPILATGLYGHQSITSTANPSLVHQAVKQKDWFWNNDYNILNGVHTHGRRYNPFGPQNYPDEVKKTREMAALRDQLIHNLASAKTQSLTVDDSKTHTLPPVPTNYQPSAKYGSQQYLYGQDALNTFTVPDGYQVELFASEKEFPNLANPMQLSFDNKGRLWVAVMPTYPHYRPGDSMPNDKILIYEDTDGDGKADKETIFAENLHLPIGFEITQDGVYVSQEPNFVLIRDTNGDDKADTYEIILGGFDTHDTHHAISAFTTDPSGAIIFCEGVFLHSNIETAYGPIRSVDGGFYRFSPQRRHLERSIQMNIPNPWGYVFDQWGQDFLIHTSGTTMNWALPVQVKPTYGSKTPSTPDLVPETHRVRPTSGLEIVSSRHFPDDVQGDLIYANAIGFLGIKQVKIQDNGTGWKTEHRHNLIQSTDGNFRPVDLEFAPDGSLYLIDWHNILIGHMQHNARDPLRDHVHGRIYRITYPSRPLVKPANIAGAPIPELLENLKLPELRTRSRTRSELRSRPTQDVLTATQTWLKQLDPNHPNYEHQRLEALWVSWGHNQINQPLLRELLNSKDYHVRAAAVRALRYNTHLIPDHISLLEKAANDEHGRVRLETTIAASWLPDTNAAKKIVAITSSKPLDEWSEPANKTATTRLSGAVEKEVSDHKELPAPTHLNPDEQKQFLTGQKIYFREGHCVTCHQPNGKGLDPAFPSIENSPWITDNDDRLIKLTMYGLMGPMEINGKKYDGMVPMTPFAGMLKDDELAAVLTYVRNSFGNKAPPIKPEQVKAIRDANPNRLNLYTVDQLLKEHPFPTK